MFKLIEALVGICQAFFLLCASWGGYSYYSGRVQYSGEAEKRRKQRVKRYGVILILAFVIGGVTGFLLLFTQMFRLLHTILL